MKPPVFNYHTHTKYCDGSDSPDKYVDEAMKHNFKHLGFSGHAPLDKDIEWAMTKEDALIYCNDVNLIKKNNNQHFSVLLGMEADYAPGISSDFNFIKNFYNLDFIIGSVHLVFTPDKKNYWFIDGPEENYINGLSCFYNNNIKKAVTAFYHQTADMISSQSFDIIGHIDKITMNNKNKFFKTDEFWYKKLVFEVLDLIKPDGPIVEVNMRGLYKNKSSETFPEKWIIKECVHRKIRLTVSSDAHKVEEVNMLLPYSYEILKECGCKELWAIDDKGQFPYNIFKKI